MSTGFSAGSSALGYLFQARYALYLILKDREELELSIEGLDDIAFDDAGTPYELLQLKHRTTPASLTDSSSDLWKTIRIWSTYLRENKISLPGTKLTLVTMGLASQNSIAFLLRSEAGKDSGRALEKSRHVAQTSTNTIVLQKHFIDKQTVAACTALSNYSK